MRPLILAVPPTPETPVNTPHMISLRDRTLVVMSLEEVRLVFKAPSMGFCVFSPRPTKTSLSGSRWMLGLLVADTSLDVHCQATGKDTFRCSQFI